ncbi:MAG: peptidoglycan DD-metalloendopeptidase family protein [Alcanivorax sp.]|nr:peptidoglycan DD-metalloendopeptidase family protein [Alcanivorax sp.]
MKRVLLPLLLLPLFGHAGETATPAQLEKLKSRIHQLSQAQSQDLHKRDKVRASLRDTEKHIGDLTRQQQALDKQAREAQAKLDKLKAQQAKLAAEKQTQLAWLAKTVRASYQAGRQERLKLLLNQEHPDQIARLLRYQEYFQQARSERLTRVNSELTDLKAIAVKVDQARADLLDRRTAVQQHASQLQAAQQERQQMLASLNQSLNSRSARIDRLKGDQQHLEKLLSQMQSTLKDIPANLGGKPFGKLAGDLPWPLSGRLATGYHSRREGALRWQGVILTARAGTPVRAVHAGRVVFSDWLRGYGLLTIIDHGGGYLSLYGYNQSLMRSVGEWVSTGDVVALAGNSGGNSTSGLYFEIRHRGRAVNPTHWCSRRVTLPPLAKQ